MATGRRRTRRKVKLQLEEIKVLEEHKNILEKIKNWLVN